MGQVALGLELLRPARLSPAAFKALLRERGWRMADAAVRWDVRPETLSRVAADPQREPRWDDLVRALPTLTRREQAAVTAARLQLYPPRPRRTPAGMPAPAVAPDAATPPAPLPSPSRPRFDWADDEDDEEFASFAPAGNGYRYHDYVGIGSELVVVSTIGTFATEGTVLVVTETRLGVSELGDAQEEYRCEAPPGHSLWLTPEQMDDWVVSTGKTRSAF